ncbi:SusC/RagA family TonB-linked outer membrane protein [Maribellus comscasis]|uniref:SusC/RagA family TonB-linked outer membrane protein n=1 Tax=Maribellus comscasis TaxID=2681766 RepID=A0A6I6K6I8_9BACT|nr:SusC/RagA family TonB-linked outer membrane protein [Maribellus comscasis]QGY45624.1 SusC/RagA family TonB-linked outer membrane protein [Maribellus comscasis]
MEKKRKVVNVGELHPLLGKLFRVMKLTTFFYLLAIIQTFAVNSYSQVTRLSLDMHNTTVKNVLLEIENNSEFYFIYSNKLVDVTRKVDVQLKNKKVDEILDIIFDGQPIQYSITDRQIILSPNGMNIEKSGDIFQQHKSVSGKVSDQNGAPLPGVTVVVKGSTKGTVTDVDGKYKLSGIDENSIIQFSFVGMEKQEIPVGGQTIIDVSMQEDAIGIEEVVAIGYGTMKKRDIVGSVATINNEDITKMPSTNLAQTLQGMSSGMMVTNNSGHPGSAPSIQIRGLNSINLSSNPLWIVDGMPIVTGADESTANGIKAVSPIAMLNPNDIESIQVLKDAAATAIYGNRASGGVILVTTKSYKGGKVNLNINYDGGISQVPFSQNDIFVDSQTWWNTIDKSRENAGLTEMTTESALGTLFQGEKPEISKEEALATNTDQLGALTRTARFHQFALSANKGFTDGGMTFSLSYRNEEGLIHENDLQRLTSRFSINFKPINKLELGFNSNLIYMKSNGVMSVEQKGNGGWKNWHHTLPWFKIYDETAQTGYWGVNSGYNMRAFSDRDLQRNDVDKYRGMCNAYVLWETPVEGLTVKGESGADLIITNSSYWKSALLDPVEPYISEANERSVTRTVLNYVAYANYKKTINDVHAIDITAGIEGTSNRAYTKYAAGIDIQSIYPELRNVGTMSSMYGSLNDGPYLMGLFARANYKLLDRYILNASYRRDGHSAFSENNRWADFYAFGAGWIVSDENFMKDISWLNLFKLRGSYGTTGNCNVSNSMTFMKWGKSSSKVFGAEYLSTRTTVGPLGSADLKWEITANMDLGFDYGLFNNRVNGSFAVYHQWISDLILNGNVQPSVGYNTNSIYQNVGDLENWGVEFNISILNIDKKYFSWKSTLNFSTNKNEVKKLNDAESGKGYIAGNRIRRVGEALNTWYLADYAYVDPDKGVYMIKQIDADAWNDEYQTIETGEIIPMTNGNVNNNRKVLSGKTTTPTYYGGFNNTFRYKNFDLNVLFNFAGGHYQKSEIREETSQYVGVEYNVMKEMVGNTWEKPGDQADYPMLMSNNFYHIDHEGNESASLFSYSYVSKTTRFLQRADYLRLKNIQLGYTLPRSVLKGNGSMRLFLGVTNLLTITGYDGLDPETWDDLPMPRTFNFGLSLNL